MLDAESQTFKYVSPSIDRLLGFTDKESINRSVAQTVTPTSLEYIQRTTPIRIERMLQGDTSYYTDAIEVIHKDGHIVPTEINMHFVKNQFTGLIEGTGVMRDITERKKTEEEREKLQEQLLQSRKMEAIGSLAGGIAHEFNNILTTIIGNTELAVGAIPERNPAGEFLEEIKKASLRARDVVRQLLGFARKSVFKLQSVHLSPVIKEAMILIRASVPAAIEIRQNLLCRSDTVMADTVQINQVLISLCTNAKNAMQEKGGVLEVKLEDTILDEKSATRYEDLSPGKYVKLIVKDSGHGIDPKNSDRIFDPYFTTTSLAEGTGMGLAVVHGIVKHHNGAINVESEPGKGTVFEVLFPLTEAEVAQEAGTLNNEY